MHRPGRRVPVQVLPAFVRDDRAARQVLQCGVPAFLAAPQGLGGLQATLGLQRLVGDVLEQHRHAPQLRRVDAKRVNVVHASEGFGGAFELDRHARRCHGTVPCKPAVFVLGSDLAHAPPHRVLDPGVRLEGAVRLHEAVVDGLARAVVDHLDDAEALVNRSQQRVVPVPARAQRDCGLAQRDQHDVLTADDRVHLAAAQRLERGLGLGEATLHGFGFLSHRGGLPPAGAVPAVPCRGPSASRRS